MGTWARELRRHGLLGAAALPEHEAPAVRLLDALHPAGIEGVAVAAAPLLADPGRVAPLLERVRTLPDDADDATVDALAAERGGGPDPGARAAGGGSGGARAAARHPLPARRRLARSVRRLLEERRP